jgi:hypothetical protein
MVVLLYLVIFTKVNRRLDIVNVTGYLTICLLTYNSKLAKDINRADVAEWSFVLKTART